MGGCVNSLHNKVEKVERVDPKVTSENVQNLASRNGKSVEERNTQRETFSFRSPVLIERSLNERERENYVPHKFDVNNESPTKKSLKKSSRTMYRRTPSSEMIPKWAVAVYSCEKGERIEN